MTTLLEELSNRENRLNELELKSQRDDNLIRLLKSQNKDQADLIKKISQERDEANQKAEEVSGIIEAVCRIGVDGLRRMRGAGPMSLDKIEPHVREAAHEVTHEPVRANLPPPIEEQPKPSAHNQMPPEGAVEETLRRYADELNRNGDFDPPQPPVSIVRPREAAGDRRLPSFVPRREAR